MSETHRSHVFLSYSEENEPFVEAVARRLKEDARLSFWFRPWHAIPGRDLQAQMEQALHDAQACAIFLGPGGLEDLDLENEQVRDAIQSLMEQAPDEADAHAIFINASEMSGPRDKLLRDAILGQTGKTRAGAHSYTFIVDSGEIKGWQNEQMRAAIQAQVEDDPAYRIIPVLLPGMARPNKRDLPPFLRLYEPVQFRRIDDEQAFKYLLAGILGIPPIQVEGFLEARQAVPSAPVEPNSIPAGEPEPSPPTPAAPPARPLHIDPVDPPIRAIRDLLLAAFTPERLRRFCQDRKEFRPIITSISPSHGLDAMVDHVIDHCKTQLLWDDLLAEVAKESPRQYARFESQQRQS